MSSFNDEAGRGFLVELCIRAGLPDKRSFCGSWIFKLSGHRTSFVISQSLNLSVICLNQLLKLLPQLMLDLWPKAKSLVCSA